MSYVFKHVGVAVADMSSAVEAYRRLFGYIVCSGPFEDPIQGVRVCFMGDKECNAICIELISPLSEKSPVSRILKQGGGAYHLCFETSDLDEALTRSRSAGWLLVTRPVPAVAFGGRRIAWVYAQTGHLVEFVER